MMSKLNKLFGLFCVFEILAPPFSQPHGNIMLLMYLAHDEAMIKIALFTHSNCSPSKQ